MQICCVNPSVPKQEVTELDSPQSNNCKSWALVALMVIITVGAILTANYVIAENSNWQHLLEGDSLYLLIATAAIDSILLAYLLCGICHNQKQPIASSTPLSLDESAPTAPPDNSIGASSAAIPVTPPPAEPGWVHFTVNVNKVITGVIISIHNRGTLENFKNELIQNQRIISIYGELSSNCKCEISLENGEVLSMGTCIEHAYAASKGGNLNVTLTPS